MKMQENEAVGLILDCALRILGMCIVIANCHILGEKTKEFIGKQLAWLGSVERTIEVGDMVDGIMEGNDA